MSKTIAGKSLFALMIAVVMACCVFFFAGCSSPTIIGSESSDTVKISIKNQSGQAITAVAVKSSHETDFSDDLKMEGDWKNDSEATLYVVDPSITSGTETTVTTESGTETEESDIVLRPLTDIQITMADGMQYVIHQLNVADIKDAIVKIDDGTAYLVYTSIETGSEVNTLDAELAYQDQLKAEEEAAKKAAEEQAAAEKAAAEQAAADQAAASQNTEKASTSKSSSQSSSKSSSSSSSKSSSKKEDACVDDIVLN